MEWFKFRMSWFTPLMKLTDEELGQVIRGLLNCVRTEEAQEVPGRGDLLLCQMTETLQEDLRQFRQKAEKKEALKEKRRAAGRKGAEAKWSHAENARGKRQEPSDAGSCHPVPSGAKGCHDLPCKNKNKNQDTQNTEEERRCTEAETEGEGGSSSVLPPAATELPVLTIPLINGTDFPVYRKDVDEYVFLYPDVNVEQELRNMKGWCQSNPTRRKTKRGVSAFINSWLKKSQQEAAMKYEPPENPFLKYATGEAEIGAFLL